MPGKLPLAVLLACAAWAPSAHAARLLITPVPGETQGGVAELMSRAVESAALEQLPDLVVLTPAALEQQLELGLARACAGDGDDAACVVEFAAALDADWVLRPRLSEAQGSMHLTLSLFDGKRAELVAQATRSARVGEVDRLREQVPGLVADVARKARIPLVAPSAGPSVAGVALVGGGALALALGALGAGGSLLVEGQYLGAHLDRAQARTWEGARILAWGASAATVIAGAAALSAGVLVWE
ncbi:MAG: hypothetical protein IT383_00195 [Deltaproteobacteria bacterium]|nr:hypothetical protein [Deltaproteobacteria bacterium]